MNDHVKVDLFFAIFSQTNFVTGPGHLGIGFFEGTKPSPIYRKIGLNAKPKSAYYKSSKPSSLFYHLRATQFSTTKSEISLPRRHQVSSSSRTHIFILQWGTYLQTQLRFVFSSHTAFCICLMCTFILPHYFSVYAHLFCFLMYYPLSEFDVNDIVYFHLNYGKLKYLNRKLFQGAIFEISLFYSH